MVGHTADYQPVVGDVVADVDHRLVAAVVHA